MNLSVLCNNCRNQHNANLKELPWVSHDISEEARFTARYEINT